MAVIASEGKLLFGGGKWGTQAPELEEESHETGN